MPGGRAAGRGHGGSGGQRRRRFIRRREWQTSHHTPPPPGCWHACLGSVVVATPTVSERVPTTHIHSSAAGAATSEQEEQATPAACNTLRRGENTSTVSVRRGSRGHRSALSAVKGGCHFPQPMRSHKDRLSVGGKGPSPLKRAARRSNCAPHVRHVDRRDGKRLGARPRGASKHQPKRRGAELASPAPGDAVRGERPGVGEGGQRADAARGVVGPRGPARTRAGRSGRSLQRPCRRGSAAHVAAVIPAPGQQTPTGLDLSSRAGQQAGRGGAPRRLSACRSGVFRRAPGGGVAGGAGVGILATPGDKPSAGARGPRGASEDTFGRVLGVLLTPAAGP